MYQETQEFKPGKGAIFKNKYKRLDKHPDYQGEITVEIPPGHRSGVLQLKLSGWTRIAKKSGETYLSLSCQPKDLEARPIPQDPYPQPQPQPENRLNF